MLLLLLGSSYTQLLVFQNLNPKLTVYIIDACGLCLFLVTKIEITIIENEENLNEAEVFFSPGFPHSRPCFHAGILLCAH